MGLKSEPHCSLIKWWELFLPEDSTLGLDRPLRFGPSDSTSGPLKAGLWIVIVILCALAIGRL